MGLIPDLITGECPWRADANEEVAPGLPQHKADENEQQANRG